MYQLTTEHSFDSAHFLAGYDGKCGNLHGHRWRVLLTVQSETLREDQQQKGMCVDFAELKKDLRTELDALDHVLIIEQGSLRESTMKALQEEKFQVVEMPFRPTAENFARYFYELFTLKGYPVAKVEVYETPNNSAVYFV
ncbi:6-carboxy-5 6 7 8-tetrahydropterin synthase [Clostridium sp. CAG:75]|jgi:6-pyruvoyltetrahydropterin/6-carboxytetrahydropterin synthase|uniref:6-pyruvoyl trahydropterin synthase family protein n=1 Tax=Clostridium sp. AM49-4BH TaxID=2293035 RepID=UPI000334A400|nr:6-carboxytetrahydropterin synthase [Clostridium sp. AM49-4BH]RHQ14916.1 6-carboxytetrahydropterin synthase [Clostridium sp. AM49-4BH]CCZ52147.1 6-carboxy-5 6 7 8-tetrahydropterin synthase [Clostridium sp. CAG:75]